ncbi:hypothetical protein MCEMSEM23_01308 [Rhabdaerophilaceae bacterium]
MNRHVPLMSDDQILNQFLTPNMYVYFRAKMPHLAPDVLKCRIVELAKYLIMAPQFPGNILFGLEMDDLWHFWVMQTREYAHFCKSLPGGTFRNHDSNDHPEHKVSWEEAEAVALATIAAKAQKAAGQKPPAAEIDKEKAEQHTKRVLSFFASYVSNFGPMKPEAVENWPPVVRMMRRMDWSLDEFNSFMLAQGKSEKVSNPELATA